MARNEDLPMAELGEVQAFYQNGLREYDKVILGEVAAKTATLLAIATQTNVATFGVPGGGKTELNEASHRIIKEIDPDNVVGIPAQADLRPNNVIGGLVELERATNGKTETISTETKALVGPSTQKIEMDEVSRTNPHAVGTTLELVRKRRTTTSAGELVLNNLVYVGVTLNPSETRQNTFVLADAMASRFPTGSVMGVRDEEITAGIMAGFQPDPEAIEPVIGLEQLAKISNFLKSDKISFPDSIQRDAVGLALRMNDRLSSEFDFHESDNRLALQLRTVAKAIAAFCGESEVGTEHVREAASYIFMARLGLSGLRGKGITVSEIDSVTRQVVEQI